MIAIERLLLSTLCFNFNLQREVESDTADKGKDVFAWNIRLAKFLKASKPFTFLAHLIAIDLHRLPIPLSYPPHTIALASLYLASFLIPGHRNSIHPHDATTVDGEDSITEHNPTFEHGWTAEYFSEMEDVEGSLVVHQSIFCSLLTRSYDRDRTLDPESVHQALSASSPLFHFDKPNNKSLLVPLPRILALLSLIASARLDELSRS